MEVAAERYDWYKIKLPKNAPVFVKKDLVSLVDEKIDTTVAKALKDNVNIRLRPDETSPILGKINKDEVINILEDTRSWYKIGPADSSFGWIHKKFVDKISAEKAKEIALVKEREDKKLEKTNTEEITLEGIIKAYGKVFKRKATHKLITENNEVYLLKGNKETLNTIAYHRVRVIGKLITDSKEKYPVVEITKTEILD